MRAHERWALLIVAALTALTFLQLCDAIYGCGCRAWWAGAASHCDIMVAGPPDCPFCVGGTARFVGIIAAVVLAQTGAIVWVSRKISRHFAALIAAGVVAYVATTLLAAGMLSLGGG